jgi:hypothetical protein
VQQVGARRLCGDEAHDPGHHLRVNLMRRSSTYSGLAKSFGGEHTGSRRQW